jgi:DNA invertase Pin-like site-specific DNA recombinase
MDTSIDTTTPNGILVFNILASVAQFEKDIDAQRIREGVKYAQEHGTKSGKPIGRERTPITDYQVQTTFNANNNNFSATARALTNDTGVEVSAGFVASRIKRMAVKESLQKSGVKIAVFDT